MVEKQLKSITFPGLNSTYILPSIDDTLSLEGMAADAKAVGDHTKNKENPHGVTWEQVGAVPAAGGDVNGYLDFRDTCMGLSWTTADGTIIHLRPYSPTNEFQLTMQNPTKGIGEYGVITINTNGSWGFSHPDNVRAGIGAAPAGYGLGSSSGKYISSPDEAIVSGWYLLQPPYAGLIDTYFGGNGALIFTSSYTSEFFRQVAYSGNNSLMYSLVRDFAQGVWGPWEWVNPPMILGVEYRTTERYKDKPVYCKAFDIGALPNSTSKIIENFVEVGCNMLRAEGCAAYTGNNETVPIQTVSTITLRHDTGALIFATTDNYGSWNGFPVVYYWKSN